MEKRLVKDILYSIYHIEDEEVIHISDIGCELLPTDCICVGNSNYDDEMEAYLEIYRLREETDEEVNTRLAKERKIAAQISERQRNDYERVKDAYLKLKQKFEPDSV